MLLFAWTILFKVLGAICSAVVTILGLLKIN